MPLPHRGYLFVKESGWPIYDCKNNRENCPRYWVMQMLQTGGTYGAEKRYQHNFYKQGAPTAPKNTSSLFSDSLSGRAIIFPLTLL